MRFKFGYLLVYIQSFFMVLKFFVNVIFCKELVGGFKGYIFDFTIESGLICNFAIN